MGRRSYRKFAGGGELDLSEFTKSVRTECDLSAGELGDDAIAELFHFADTTVRFALPSAARHHTTRVSASCIGIMINLPPYCNVRRDAYGLNLLMYTRLVHWNMVPVG
jgi:hypothetical protein